MIQARLTDEDIAIAKQIWSEYQRTHDLSHRKGEMAGIDPATGEVWIGEWITDIAAQRRAQGKVSPLLFERIGNPTGLRKGGRRTWTAVVVDRSVDSEAWRSREERS